MAKTNEATNTESTEATAPTRNAILKPHLDKDNLKKLRGALGGDRVQFVTDDESTAYEKAAKLLEKAAAATTPEVAEGEPEAEPFYGIPLIIRQGGESDPIEDAECITVATNGVRDTASKTNGVRAIIVWETPTVEAFLLDESEAGQAFVSKVIEREAADVSFSAVRTPDVTLADMERIVKGMPVSVADIVNTARTSSGVNTDAFDILWNPFRQGVIKVKAKPLYDNLPKKPEVVKAMRSASYAKSNPATVAAEERGLWARLLQMMIELAPNFTDEDGKPAPVDTEVLESWLEGRDSLDLNYEERIATADDLDTLEL